MGKFKNIALSIAVIAGVAGLLFGATQATWTSEDVNHGNIVSSNYIGVRLGGLPSYYDANNNPVYATEFPLFFEDGPHGDPWTQGTSLWPGEKRTAYLEVANQSTGEMAFDVGVANFDNHGHTVSDTDLTDVWLDKVLNIEFTPITDLSNYPYTENIDCTTYDEPYNEGGKFTVAPCDQTWDLWATPGTGFLPGAILNDYNSGLHGPFSKIFDGNSNIPVRHVAVYEIEIEMHADADNTYQGRKTGFDIVVIGRQAE